MLGDGRLSDFEELLQRPNLFRKFPDERVSVGVVDGYGVHNLLGSLHVSTQKAVDGRRWTTEVSLTAGFKSENFVQSKKKNELHNRRGHVLRETTHEIEGM